MKKKRILDCVSEFSCATGSEPDEDLAYVLFQDLKTGYCLSVSRFPHEDDLVEVMVYDQIVHKTDQVAVVMRPRELRLTLSEAAATQLDGTIEYVVQLSVDADFQQIDNALRVIFDGKHGGTYVRET